MNKKQFGDVYSNVVFKWRSMSNKKTSGTNLTEDDIINLLVELRMEPHPEANFEDRFVHDFKERVATYAVTRPARKVLWEHILLRLTGIGKLKWACGATTLGVGVLAVGFLSWPGDDAAEQKRVAPAIGSARVVSRTAPIVDPRDVIVSSSLELESATCIVPAQVNPVFGANHSYSSLENMNHGFAPIINTQAPKKASQHITLPVIDSGATVVPSMF